MIIALDGDNNQMQRQSTTLIEEERIRLAQHEVWTISLAHNLDLQASVTGKVGYSPLDLIPPQVPNDRGGTFDVTSSRNVCP